jgi:hypothetical protein
MTIAALDTFYGNIAEGGRQPTIFLSRVGQYNRYKKLLQSSQRFPQTNARDEQLANGNFDNVLFNSTPWTVDSKCFDGPNSTNSAVVALTEDFWELYVHPARNFFLEDFQTPVNQDAMVSKILWGGMLVCSSPQTQGKMSALTG